jgi:aldose 1-epimerase
MARTLTGTQFEIKAGRHSATVVEVGAGLRRYSHDGVDVTARYDPWSLPPKGCGATLVPWPNRLRGGRYTFEDTIYQVPLTEPDLGNANHGLARWVRWTPIVHTRSRVTLRCDLVPQSGYPFEIAVEVTYALSTRTGLTVTAGARSLGGPAPFGAGFHPYLSTHGRALEETTVRVPARTRLVLDDKQIPVDRRPVGRSVFDLRRGKRLGSNRFDDGFTDLSFVDGRATAEVSTAAGGAELWVDEAFQYLQVFTVPSAWSERAAVAVEPMTCAPDAFNSGAGLLVLNDRTRTKWSGTWGITPL